jgi:hypothetical protein
VGGPGLPARREGARLAPRLWRSAACAGIAITVAVVAACSGDSDSGPPSVAEFRNEANAVCRDAAGSLADIDPPTAPRDFAASLEEALPLQEALIEDLREVEPSEELVETYGDALGILSEQRSLGQQALNDIDGGGDAAAVVTTLGPEIQESEERIDEIMLELGLADCAQGGDPGPPGNAQEDP